MTSEIVENDRDLKKMLRGLRTSSEARQIEKALLMIEYLAKVVVEKADKRERAEHEAESKRMRESNERLIKKGAEDDNNRQERIESRD